MNWADWANTQLFHNKTSFLLRNSWDQRISRRNTLHAFEYIPTYYNEGGRGTLINNGIYHCGRQST